MAFDLFQSLLTNLWVLFLVVLLFGGSIFVHELGHFLAARRRGAVVERFSIGFGPAIFKWTGKDGVEYRVSWFPLGGYVLLPQLADLGAVEGQSSVDTAKLPPVSYATKMIVFAAGAAFNILFAFFLACIVWVIGQPAATGFTSTTIAEIAPTIKDSSGKDVVSPAVKAGLKPGDVILKVDGQPVESFADIVEHLALSSGWNKQGERQTTFTLKRDNALIDVPIQPILSGDENVRKVGFQTVAKLYVGPMTPGSPAEKSGLQPGDLIKAVNGAPTLTPTQLFDGFRKGLGKPMQLTVARGTEQPTFTLAPAAKIAELGLSGINSGVTVVHPNPFLQIRDTIVKTFRTLWALINPRSDINASHLSGPIGIIDNFIAVSRAGLPLALWFTILVNINLAIFNLLPMPVLDGGQMLFATIGRLRGRPLPVSFIMTAQSVFLVLLFSMVLYVSVFDVRRIVRDVKADRAAEAAPAPAPAPSVPAESAPSPAPAK
ncbi:RIP metalloprotease RseP [Horticoccus sp. 23ND18S-11]|uniref:RIP metalloprotease RseP n=1 Tax=Horticoccus sp. 23ND18S-11 TaxID=3391832 RepID=UPI0039C93E56